MNKNQDFKIRQRKLKRNEAILLVEKIKETPNITGYSLREWLNFSNLLIAESNEERLIGICTCCDFGKRWTFLSVLFVLKEFRGQGVGTILFNKTCDISLSRKKNLYTSSQNPTVIKMMKAREFITFTTLIKLPRNYKRYEFVFFVRLLKWLISCYRIKEIHRKSKIFSDSYKDKKTMFMVSDLIIQQHFN